MAGLLEAASAILSSSGRRVEVVAHNIANVTTPGYRSLRSFESLVSSGEPGARVLPRTQLAVRGEAGRIEESAGELDIAITGQGFFRLRNGESFVYTRQGQFQRREDGTVVNAQGYALQQAGGGDVVLGEGAVELRPDGTLVEDGRPIARVGLFRAADGQASESVSGTLLRIADGVVEEVEEPQLRQHALEGSNVVLADEMVTMMAAMRHAEAGARLVTTYDELIGRAITSLGQAR